MNNPLMPKTYPTHVKLALSMVSNRPVEPRCEISLAMIVHHLTAYGVPFGIFSRLQASLLPQARQECLDEAIAEGCTHQLWIDDDIEAPGDCALRMLVAMKEQNEIDALAVNYCRKQQDSLQYTCEGLDGRMTESMGKIGVEEIDKCGMGLMMVRLEGIKDIPAPHFEVCWSPEHGKYRGEDRYFTKKMRDAGLRIFVDHGISNHTQHWGSVGFSFNSFRLVDPKKTDEGAHRAQDGIGE